jgi:hypothetical protein
MKKAKGGADKRPEVSRSAFEMATLAAELLPAAGKSAVEGKYRALIKAKNGQAAFTGSVDMDGAFKKAEPKANRWDYGLGLQQRGRAEFAIWVEPHSGSSHGEVTTMIAKLDWLRGKLASRGFEGLLALTDEAGRQGKRKFIWLSSGTVGIRPGSRAAKMLSSVGMGLPATYVEI